MLKLLGNIIFILTSLMSFLLFVLAGCWHWNYEHTCCLEIDEDFKWVWLTIFAYIASILMFGVGLLARGILMRVEKLLRRRLGRLEPSMDLR